MKENPNLQCSELEDNINEIDFYLWYRMTEVQKLDFVSRIREIKTVVAVGKIINM